MALVSMLVGFGFLKYSQEGIKGVRETTTGAAADADAAGANKAEGEVGGEGTQGT